MNPGLGHHHFSLPVYSGTSSIILVLLYFSLKQSDFHTGFMMCRIVFFNLFNIYVLVHGNIKEEDILVLPLDALKFETHSSATQDVLKYFSKVRSF